MKMRTKRFLVVLVTGAVVCATLDQATGVAEVLKNVNFATRILHTSANVIVGVGMGWALYSKK